MRCAQDLKSALLLELLRGDGIKSAIVFTRTKHRANRLAHYLERHGVGCERVHGNRSQGQRTEALEGFKDGRFRVLVATDIAARGIDVEGLSHVINFDVPHVPEDYIHRVGRTARAGATGEALTFVSPEEVNELRAIERAVAKVLPRADGGGLRLPGQGTGALRDPRRRTAGRDARPEVEGPAFPALVEPAGRQARDRGPARRASRRRPELQLARQKSGRARRLAATAAPLETPPPPARGFQISPRAESSSFR